MGTFIKYRIKCFLKNKTLIFWTFLFPCALATIFNFVLRDIQVMTEKELIKVAVVEVNNESLKGVIDELSDSKSDNYILDTTYTTSDKAEAMLDDGKVSAVVYLEEKPRLNVISYGYDQTILKSLINSYSRVYSQFSHLLQSDPTLLQKMAVEELYKSNLEIKTKQSEGSKKDVNMVYFYNAIAMCCLYGMLWGVRICSDSQATQSKQAARVNVSPLPKWKALGIDFLIGFTCIVIEASLSVLYMSTILDIAFTNHIGLLLIVLMASAFMSLSLGILVGTIKVLKFEAKVGVISAITIFLNFLAGMMANTMPYIIDTFAPIVRYLNPADLIVRSFSMLYYYTDMQPIYLNIGIMLMIGSVVFIISYMRIRRVSYASI